MNLRNALTAAVAVASLTLAASAAFAQSHPEFIPIGRVSAALYKPDSGPAAHVLFLVSHRTGNNLNNPACRELAQRGYDCLGWNTRFVNNESQLDWEQISFDSKAAMDYARKVPGITKVVWIAHSGGSPLAASYEAIAENGPSVCQGADKLIQCPSDNRTGWTPADGIIYPDAHPGNGTQALRGINPALSIKGGKVVTDPSLDPFDPKNGFNPKGPSHYSKEFQQRYYAAQSAKMNGYIAEAQKKMAEIKAGKYTYPDNDVMVIPFAGEFGSAALNIFDPDNELQSTKRPERLLKNDGTIVTQVVHSVLVPQYDYIKNARTFNDGAWLLTLTSFLSSNSVKSTNSMGGIDHCSSNNSTVCEIRSIRIPSLWAAMGAWKFVRDQEDMYDESPAKDKEYIVIEGAVHTYTPCKPCETTPGQYANSEKNLFDYIKKWTDARFPASKS